MLLYTWQEAGKKGRLILSSGAKYNQINFSKNYVSGNARKIGVTFIWWFTSDHRSNAINSVATTEHRTKM